MQDIKVLSAHHRGKLHVFNVLMT